MFILLGNLFFPYSFPQYPQTCQQTEHRNNLFKNIGFTSEILYL